jgi:hypothetical protein
MTRTSATAVIQARYGWKGLLYARPRLVSMFKSRLKNAGGIRTISTDALSSQGIEKPEVCDLDHKPPNQASNRGDVDEPSKHHRRVASETQVDKWHENERCSHCHIRRSESVGA